MKNNSDNRLYGRRSDQVSFARLLWSLGIKSYHFAPLRLCALARMSLLIQAMVLAKAQRRKGRKGKILAMVELNSQRPSKDNERIHLQSRQRRLKLLISINRRCRDWNDYVTAPRL